MNNTLSITRSINVFWVKSYPTWVFILQYGHFFLGWVKPHLWACWLLIKSGFSGKVMAFMSCLLILLSKYHKIKLSILFVEDQRGLMIMCAATCVVPRLKSVPFKETPNNRWLPEALHGNENGRNFYLS